MQLHYAFYTLYLWNSISRKNITYPINSRRKTHTQCLECS
ncbi:hypothetical protein M3J09_003636 [Ascochyta lentis]